ncbi:GNAT family N-acetyltransferase [uncultured Rothia sp.]|uniref:GNAT family N-acetyltransferase n=1 Tax=uncultured Rothia sp. TaxID=316088 RepID=UPI0032167CAE
MTNELAARELETDRMRLRPLLATDASFLADLYSDAEVARYIGGDRLDGAAATRQANTFAQVWDEKGYGQSVVVDKSAQQKIGRVGLHPWKDWGEIELGWVISASWQRQGRATEAAQAWLEFAKQNPPADYLIAVVHSENIASHRLAQSLGFVKDRDDITPWNPVVVWRYDL